MAGRRSEAPRSRRRVVPVVATVAALSLVGGLAVFAEGYDAQEVPRAETFVWVTRDAGQYARVNTDLAEIDTVRIVDDPTAVAQAGSRSIVFSQGYRQLWPVDSANPVDLVTAVAGPSAGAEADDAAEGDEAEAQPEAASSGMHNTPLGTRSIATSGEYVLYLTDTGTVWVSALVGADGEAPAAVPINPYADVVPEEGEEPPAYQASAVAVSDTGRVALYSADEAAVRLYDASTYTFSGDPTQLATPPDADARLEFAIVGDSWVLSSAGEGLVWIDGLEEPVDVDRAADARLQSSTSQNPSGGEAGNPVAYLADSSGLVSVDLASGAVEELAGATGVPAAPVVVGDVAYAAWLSTESGSLWSSESNDTIALELDGDELEQVQSIVPSIHSNGQRAILAEHGSGMMWTIPDGTLIPIAQWNLDEEDETAGTVKVDDVSQQEPPVAVADSFGVRRGQLVALPLLLNDHDPNKKDVLSIVPASLGSGLADPAFGDLGLVSNNQSAVVRVRAESGATTFTYAVTDGAAESAPVTVTLTVVPDDANSAPVWCGVEACRQVWPTPQIAPGGTASIPVLSAWVDPEGDAIVLTEARKNDVSDPVSIVPTADGRVAIRHNDPNAPEAVIALTITVADSRGATAERELLVSVSSNPALIAAPAAVVAGVDERTTIQIADYVSGGSGAYRVIDAVETAASASGLVVVANAAAGTIELTASTAGDYLVTYTVQDSTTLAEQSALVRLTTVTGGTPLAIAPLTAFVRANEDTTVAVLGAVQNTTGRVLIVTEATSADPALSVSVVGQSRVRVSGSTPDGQPGLIGTATIMISDGNSARVEGQVAVFLVAGTTATNPIAVPDTVTARAGAQVDIPVLDNDFSPRGERLVVHPQVEGSGTAGELAFAGETSVRYLAPSTPGVYTLRYTTYLEGQPERIDTATISVTVLPPGSNRAPQPPILTARAIAGQTVEIPVDGYGMDPDGDEVVLAGVAMPKAGEGVASVSADGGSIRYAAPAAGVPGGQVTFGYTVRDSDGERAVGIVRVGVVSGEFSDVTPVTYSDYVRVQLGSTAPVRVSPMLDDRDPVQGVLNLIDLVPNAPNVEGNSEYARLVALIDPSTSLLDGEVALRAGSVLGTHSYVYTVQSSISTSTAQGLIVVDVTDGEAPDIPIVTDTVLTAKDRNQLAKGIDVVSGKVQWASGTVGDLTLSLWGDALDRFSVSGSTIAGEAPAAGALVPFALTGRASGGAAVETYGFLRIPAFDDMRVQVRAGVDAVEVGEEKTVAFAVRDMLDLDSSETVEVNDDSPFVAQRVNAKCAAAASGRAEYSAGREAPWVDSCTIPVRLEGQREWTSVSVPVDILPKDPQAILSSVTRTIAPGASESIDLYANLTTWEGGRVGDIARLDYATAFAGSAFIVTQQGSTVSIDTRADARPGTRETIQVSVSSFGGLSAGITLIVGVAPIDAPRGATFTQQCDVSRGATCAITVIGVGGQYDPFEGKTGAGLTLVSVGTGAPVSCTVATVSVASATQIVATWPSGPKPVGGTCVVPITVKDAQGRSGPGQVTIDVLGFPQVPSSVTTVGYTGSSVTLTIPLGDANQAHPAVTGVSIWKNGQPVPASCGPAGPGARQCVVPGLTNGERHNFTARAENAVGQSLDTTSVETWAYEAPVVTALAASPRYDPNVTTQQAGVATLRITAGDDARAFRISNTNQTIPRTGEVTEHVVTLAPGAHLIEVTPISQFSPPIGNQGNEGGLRSAPVTVAGLPYYDNSGSTSRSGNSITLSGTAPNANNSAAPGNRLWVAWKGGRVPQCVMTSGGGIGVQGGDGSVVTSTSSQIDGLEEYTVYHVRECVTYGFGAAGSDPRQEFTYVAPNDPPAGLTYTVDVTPSQSGNTFTYGYAQPSIPPSNRPGFVNEYSFDGRQTDSFSLSPDYAPNRVDVRYCRTIIYKSCTEYERIAAATAPTTVVVAFPGGPIPEAEIGGYHNGWVSSAARPHASVTVATKDEVAKTVTFTVSFLPSSPFASLSSVTSPPIPYTPTPEPEPEPEPEPPPGPGPGD